ncbi:hypothetical protein ACERIT_11700 [Halopenitus sp. H-Gu1]|uniref:hypothetical protein n=1 Tax=Halopenitus sp. H-Gu1 TaxID=3242697 RepID=UPI00359DB498
MTGYYDYVLGLIPAALIGVTAALMSVGLPLVSAVPIGATVTIGLMGHAMFVNSPADGTPVRSDTPATAGSATASRPTPTNAD